MWHSNKNFITMHIAQNPTTNNCFSSSVFPKGQLLDTYFRFMQWNTLQ